MNPTGMDAVLDGILHRWERLTGVRHGDPIRNLGQIHVERLNRRIVEARRLDAAGGVAVLVVRTVFATWCADVRASMADLLDPDGRGAGMLADARAMRDALMAAEPSAAADACLAGLRGLAAAHGLAPAAGWTDEVLGEAALDALITVEDLDARIHRPMPAGAPPTDGTPRVNPHIWRVPDLPSLTAAVAAHHEDGATMAMVETRARADVHFAVAVRRRGAIVVASDADERRHPLEGAMRSRRRPERDIDDRSERHRFPYGLADRTASITAGVTVPGAAGVRPVAVAADMEPERMLWWLLVVAGLDRRIDRMLADDLAPRAATGAEVAAGHAARLLAHGPGLPAPGGLPAVVADAIAAHPDHGDRVGVNDHLLVRHGAAVDPDALRLVDVGEGVLRILGDDGVLRDPPPRLLAPRAGRTQAKVPDIAEHDLLTKPPDGFDLTACGDPARIEADRRWMARYNLAREVHRLAIQDFTTRWAAVVEAVAARIRARLPVLLDRIRDPEPWLGTVWCMPTEAECAGNHGKRFDQVPRRRSILHVHDTRPTRTAEAADDFPAFIPTNPGSIRLFRRDDTGNRTWIRRFRSMDDKPIAALARLRPGDAADLAAIAGCAVADLPEPVRTWRASDAYIGNEILERIDPMDWACDDPWRLLEWNIWIGLPTMRGRTWPAHRDGGGRPTIIRC